MTASVQFTVFTPTYNRAHTLNRVYESLCQQSFKDFEWLIVDDGSEDQTHALVETWQQESSFPIRYEYQSNQGKHMAMNRGVRAARGELFLPIDSDDGFEATALEHLHRVWMDIPPLERERYTGVVCRCQSEDGNPCSPSFPSDPYDATSLDLRFKLKIRGELWGFHRTDVLKRYPFPEESSLGFIPENIVWDAIARRYKVRCINAPLRLFYQDSGNQLTKRPARLKAHQGRYFLAFINRDIDYFWSDPRTFFKWAILYIRYSLHAGEKEILSAYNFGSFMPYLVCCIAFFPGWVAFCLDQYKEAHKQ